MVDTEPDGVVFITFGPLLGVAIPKDDGTQRLFGVASVLDRLLQQAAHQEISLKYEPGFTDDSYGFRRGRNAHQAVRQAQKNIHEGYDYIVVTGN